MEFYYNLENSCKESRVVKGVLKYGTNKSFAKENWTFSTIYFFYNLVVLANYYYSNRYFNALWYGEPLFYIPMLIGGLGPAFSSYIIYQTFNKESNKKSFLKFIFDRKIDRKSWLIFGFYII
ncbi:hypothetical protein SAMN04488114_11420 [Carnobacterium iners]|nr:hypothetical protein SAMN04488114_11420 [Carnobacterium iners]